MLLLFLLTLSQLGHPALTPQATAVYAVWADTGKPIASFNENLPLNPASNTKLVTAYCSLKELGPGFRFETRFYSDAPLRNGTLRNFWVKGEGDPSMVNESLQAMVEWLKQEGLRSITGQVYIDDSFFDVLEYPGRQENNTRAYNAPTSATPLNFNTREVQIKKKKKRITVYRSVRNAPEFFGNALIAEFRKNGIAVNGKAKTGLVSGKQPLWTWESKPLREIVQDMNKFSNNFIAEQLTKFLGAKGSGPPGNTEKGVRVFQNCLAKAGISAFGLHLENGSGLSYNNRATAKQLVEVLAAGMRDRKIRDAFISSLSIGGVDGTMKPRRLPQELSGVLRAKTGSLIGINTLAGFVPAENGGVVIFAILMNDTKGDFRVLQRIQDEMVLNWSRLKR